MENQKKSERKERIVMAEDLRHEGAIMEAFESLKRKFTDAELEAFNLAIWNTPNVQQINKDMEELRSHIETLEMALKAKNA